MLRRVDRRSHPEGRRNPQEDRCNPQEEVHRNPREDPRNRRRKVLDHIRNVVRYQEADQWVGHRRQWEEEIEMAVPMDAPMS